MTKGSNVRAFLVQRNLENLVLVLEVRVGEERVGFEESLCLEQLVAQPLVLLP